MWKGTGRDPILAHCDNCAKTGVSYKQLHDSRAMVWNFKSGHSKREAKPKYRLYPPQFELACLRNWHS